MPKVSRTSNKTKPTKRSVATYLQTLTPQERIQAEYLVELFAAATGYQPVLWGAIVGFGSYHYRYDSGREGDFLATGFAIRKSGPVLYIMPGYADYGAILADLGPHKLGKSCIYLKDATTLNRTALIKLIKTGVRDLAGQYPVNE